MAGGDQPPARQAHLSPMSASQSGEVNTDFHFSRGDNYQERPSAEQTTTLRQWHSPQDKDDIPKLRRSVSYASSCSSAASAASRDSRVGRRSRRRRQTPRPVNRASKAIVRMPSRGSSSSRSRTVQKELSKHSLPGTLVPSATHPWFCGCCPYNTMYFESAVARDLHEHGKRYSCAYCLSRFRNKNELERHRHSLHPDTNRLYASVAPRSLRNSTRRMTLSCTSPRSSIAVLIARIASETRIKPNVTIMPCI